jgi:hypothetical protein
VYMRMLAYACSRGCVSGCDWGFELICQHAVQSSTPF